MMTYHLTLFSSYFTDGYEIMSSVTDRERFAGT